MNFLELAKIRESVRKYDSRPVKREDILTCLEAARLAPSACNSQPWEFIVVDKPELKAKTAAAALSGIYGMNTFIKDAPVLIAVVSDSFRILTKIGSGLRDSSFYLVDLGIACEHLVLEAAELGLGTCWLGWFNEKAVKKVLNVGHGKRIHIMISLGYPAEGYIQHEKARKELSEMAKFPD